MKIETERIEWISTVRGEWSGVSVKELSRLGMVVVEEECVPLPGWSMWRMVLKREIITLNRWRCHCNTVERGGAKRIR